MRRTWSKNGDLSLGGCPQRQFNRGNSDEERGPTQHGVLPRLQRDGVSKNLVAPAVKEQRELSPPALNHNHNLTLNHNPATRGLRLRGATRPTGHLGHSGSKLGDRVNKFRRADEEAFTGKGFFVSASKFVDPITQL